MTELDILNLFNHELDIGPSDVAQAKITNKGTASRILKAMADDEWLTKVGDRYQLGANAARLFLNWTSNVRLQAEAIRTDVNQRLAQIDQQLTDVISTDSPST